ncbi:hypothetical protein WJX77_004920 [Trebouxia sp. C0004]
MQPRLDLSPEAAIRIHQLEQHVQQLQQEAQTAGALEYRCAGLLQEKQQLAQQLQHLKGNVVQMQSALHQERLLRQERESDVAQSAAEQLEAESRCKDLQAKLRVAERRASEAKEEHLNMEQELAAMNSEAESAQQNSSAIDASASTQRSQPNDEQLHQELHAAQIRADDLSVSLMSTESALNSAQTELSSAKARVVQLEQSLTGQAAADGQVYINGVSQLPSGRRQASSRLPSGAGSASSGSLPDDTAQLLQRLRGQVSSLKASRDKLLVEVDRQSLEIERLLTDNSALMQGLAQMQESAQTWEVQAQENLQHMDQLKTLLEESAFWQSQSAQPSIADADGCNPDHQCVPDEAQLQKEVLQEKARATGLEVQIRALCLELVHARENAGLLSQSIVPTLGNIGSRIAQLLQVKAVQQAVR